MICTSKPVDLHHIRKPVGKAKSYWTNNSATHSLAEGRSTRTNPYLSLQTGDEASHLR